MLTIKELTQAVGKGTTPRMVRHYHHIGLPPQPRRFPWKATPSRSNYRLYSEADIQRLQQIVALKQQRFQISHIKQILATRPAATQLRQTATALERLIGRDQDCQFVQAEALFQLRLVTAENELARSLSQSLWQRIDAAAPDHPEHFQHIA